MPEDIMDGNGRISRLLMNTALIQDGYIAGGHPAGIAARIYFTAWAAHRDDQPFMEFIADRILESK